MNTQVKPRRPLHPLPFTRQAQNQQGQNRRPEAPPTLGVELQPLDSFRMRVYMAPRGLWLTLDAGQFEKVAVNAKTGAVRVGLASVTPETSQARLRIEQPAQIAGSGGYRPRQQFKREREAFVIPLKQGTTWVELSSGR